jgi:hypothetical protein
MFGKSLLMAALLAAAVTLPGSARADAPKVGNTAMGAVAGAVVLGPIGLLAGGVIGYAAGEDIARGMGIKKKRKRPPRAVERID